MKEKIITAVLASLITTSILWLAGLLPKLPSLISVPPSAVIPFNLENCPDGWKEFSAAYGVFIRGIDPTDSGIDPDGIRKPSNYQVDMFAEHTHPGKYSFLQPQGVGSHTHKNLMLYGGNDSQQFELMPDGGAETRPKNIALLYCEKR